MVRILLNWIMSVLVVFATGNLYAISKKIRLHSLQVFLNQLPVIRVGIGEAPGNGHQSAGAVVVQRLRELGYKGTIEVVYDTEETAEKLVFLMPPFKGFAAGSTQEFPEQNLRFVYTQPIFKGAASLTTVPLAIVGADDLNIKAVDLNADALLRLQPHNWKKVPTLTVDANGEKQFFELKELGDLGFYYEPPSPTHVVQFLADNMKHGPFKGKLPFLKSLLAVPNKREVLPVYGHGVRNGDYQLEILLKALVDGGVANENIYANGIVIPIINEMTEDYIFEAKEVIQKKFSSKEFPVEYYHFDDPKLMERIPLTNDKRIIVVSLGALPKPIFEYLYMRQTLPGVVEGRNSMNFMALIGKPYLPSAAHESFHFFNDAIETKLLGIEGLSEMERLIGRAWWELGKSWRMGSTFYLQRFYLTAFNNPRKMATFFASKQIRSKGIFREDQLLLGLEFYKKQIEKKETSQSFRGAAAQCTMSLQKMFSPFGAYIKPY